MVKSRKYISNYFLSEKSPNATLIDSQSLETKLKPSYA